MRAIPFDGSISNSDTRAAMSFHLWSATLQPISTFFNALRERLSFARRAGVAIEWKLRQRWGL